MTTRGKRFMLLSACMIVRNEERFLEGALLSLKDVADEIVVVDTGSTDRTLSLCADHGARICQFPWNGDFSAARNEGLKQARGRWILSIDADERLRPCCTSLARSLSNDTSKIAYYSLLQPKTQWTGMRVLRLFRNDPRLRYQGFIHESIRQDIERILVSDGLEIGESGLIMDHVGYDGDQSSKHWRNLPLLLKELERDPQNTNNRRHLALIYAEMGEDDLAEETLRTIIFTLRQRDKLESVDSLPFVDLILQRLQRGEEANGLLDEAMALFPENPHLFWLQGRVLMDRDCCAEAVPFFERLIQWGKRNDFDRSISYDTRIFNIHAYDSLATCFFRLGRYSQSEKYFEIARRCAPEQLEYTAKATLCALRKASLKGTASTSGPS
ncbi:MAG: hypothetical protein CVU64_00710 [Deltaproteobacteria bacterium HGW-Deltaproteobacteria-21]|nr:MAG: hypothetical protein CVU64_00710 [Deltaproteobacteria bacterium HGW-Deltaproteobacteria-21]